MYNIVAIIQIILQIGFRCTLFSTGGAFDPVYQERTTPYEDFRYKNCREYNFEYKVDEWTPTFKEKKEC